MAPVLCILCGDGHITPSVTGLQYWMKATESLLHPPPYAGHGEKQGLRFDVICLYCDST